MNKLIMAALWCFSVAVYADIYVCESEISEEIVAPNVLTGSYINTCLLYTSPSPRDGLLSRMPSSA